MPAFKYRQGDRPLDGYTIEYGLGRGGFGEVYYALSDSGREVALKAVQNYEEIELRGIRHCMNLKSPHLVTIFDVKHNDRDEPFVIMEYVSGPSLRDLLDDAPNGLGETKAAYFLREISKGLSYLHDNGIVHRDLKPHNVFYEDGYVKIGDYSLSKALTSSHRSGHTVTVGTVHYMAPEISMGRYDARVDIYALGIMLFEMIKGQPPFVGESMGEVLMKHVAGELDVSGISEPFASTIRKALAKNPEERFASAAEMASSVFGHQHINESVAEFNPQHLTLVAQQAGRKVLAGAGGPPLENTPGRSAAETPTEYLPRSGELDAIPRLAYHAGRGVGNLSHRAVPHAAYQAGRALGLIATHSGVKHFARSAAESDDPVSHQRRISLALVSAAVLAFGCVVTTEGGATIRDWVWVLATMLGGAMGSVAGGRFVVQSQGKIPWPLRRLIIATTAWLGGWLAMLLVGDWMGGAWISFVPLLILDWREMMSPSRRLRLRLVPTLTCGVIAMILAYMNDGNVVIAAGLAAGMAMTVQVASPYRGRRVSEDTPGPALRTAELSREAVPHPQPFVAVDPDASAAEPPVVAAATPGPPSPYSRAIASVLAAVPYFIGVCGLQRFYVGKIGSGILFLLTFGVCGIGQLVDFIVILMGQFQDAEKRYLSEWQGVPGGQSSTPVNSWSSVPNYARPLGAWLASVVGLLLLATSIVLGLLLAVNAPQGLLELDQYGVVNTGINSAMEAVMGTSDWPGTLRRIGILAAAVIFLLATSIQLFARRQHGITHIMRAVLGSLVCIASVMIVAIGFQTVRWQDVGAHLQEDQVAMAFDEFLSNDRLLAVIYSAAALLGGIIILCWPPRAVPADAGLVSRGSLGKEQD